MKKANKKSLAIMLTFLGLGTYLNAQVSVPTNGVPGTTASYVGWNTTRNFPLTISHKGNFPINIETNGIERIHINENKTLGIGNSINGFQVNTSGFVGIGPNTNNLWNNPGPFTLLHLNGETASGDFAQEWGYRSWMRTGISFTDQIDYSYVGYRSVDPTSNLNEFTISWGNDLVPASSNSHGGPDDMVFRFVAAIGPDVVPNPPTEEKGANDFTRNDDMDGRHIARFTPNGFFA